MGEIIRGDNIFYIFYEKCFIRKSGQIDDTGPAVTPQRCSKFVLLMTMPTLGFSNETVCPAPVLEKMSVRIRKNPNCFIDDFTCVLLGFATEIRRIQIAKIEVLVLPVMSVVKPYISRETVLFSRSPIPVMLQS